MHFLFLFFFYNLFRCTWWKPGPTKGKGKTTADFSSPKIHLNWLCLKVRYLVQDNHLGSFYSPCRKVLAPPASIHPPVSDSYLGMGWDESVGAVSLSTDCGRGWKFEITLSFGWLFFSCQWQGWLLAMWWHSPVPAEECQPAATLLIYFYLEQTFSVIGLRYSSANTAQVALDCALLWPSASPTALSRDKFQKQQQKCVYMYI